MKRSLWQHRNKQLIFEDAVRCNLLSLPLLTSTAHFCHTIHTLFPYALNTHHTHMQFTLFSCAFTHFSFLIGTLPLHAEHTNPCTHTHAHTVHHTSNTFSAPMFTATVQRLESWVYLRKLLHRMAGWEMFVLNGQGSDQQKAWSKQFPAQPVSSLGTLSFLLVTGRSQKRDLTHIETCRVVTTWFRHLIIPLNFKEKYSQHFLKVGWLYLRKCRQIYT